MCAAVGLVVSGAGAVTARPLAAGLGFMITSVALVSGVVLGVLFRMRGEIAEITDILAEMRRRLAQSDRDADVEGENDAGEPVPDHTELMDLAASGGGDPASLVAATLDRSTFPRLVQAGDSAFPDGSNSRYARGAAWGTVSATDEGVRTSLGELANRSVRPRVMPGGDGGAERARIRPAGTDPRRAWEIALREGDLPACRDLFANLAESASAGVASTLRWQFENLARRIEASLRSRFAECVRNADYGEALSIGGRICTLLPGSRAAGDFRRIEPYLVRRSGLPGGGCDNAPSVSAAGENAVAPILPSDGEGDRLAAC